MNIQDQLAFKLCANDFHIFCFGLYTASGRRSFLFTRDEHDAENPLKPFPDHKYLRVVSDLFLVAGHDILPSQAEYAIEWGISAEHLQHAYDTGKIAIEKSRQLMITWICLAYILWRAKFHEHQLIMVQSKRAEDADALVCRRENDQNARLCILEDNLPPFLRTIDFLAKGSALKGVLNFPTQTTIQAIPEGGAKIRSYTPTIVMSDEAAFQPEFGEAYKAVLPAVQNGGLAIFVSSAEVSAFQQMVGAADGIVEGNDDTLIDGARRSGLTTRISETSQMLVCRLHYSADPDRNPMTPTGAAWFAAAAQGYIGGTTGAGWLKEQEIQYTAGGGGKVFPHIMKSRRDSKIFIDIDQVDFANATLWGSFDFGFATPACYLVHAVYPSSFQVRYQTIWEFYAEEVHIPEIAKIILGQSIVSSDGRRFEGNPYAGKEIVRVADPSINQTRNASSINETRSVIELFQGLDVWFTRGQRGNDVTVADYISGTLWNDPYNPQYQIVRSCSNLIAELELLQREERSLDMEMKKGKSEKFMKGRDHAWDALKYFLQEFPVGVSVQKTNEIGYNSFDYWKRLGMNRTSELPYYRRLG
jgi:hypothetical protein